jgi:hypothetical protein
MAYLKRNRPMTRIALAAAAGAVATALLSVPASADNAEKVRPGYWEYAYKVAGIRVSSEKKCIKPNEIDKVFFAGPCNHHHKCVYPVRQIGDGKAKFDGTWTDKRGRVAHVAADGTYTETTFNLKAHGTTTTGIPMSVTMNAKWLGACPA